METVMVRDSLENDAVNWLLGSNRPESGAKAGDGVGLNGIVLTGSD
jgi:hypothetical protein